MVLPCYYLLRSAKNSAPIFFLFYFSNSFRKSPKFTNPIHQTRGKQLIVAHYLFLNGGSTFLERCDDSDNFCACLSVAAVCIQEFARSMIYNFLPTFSSNYYYYYMYTLHSSIQVGSQRRLNFVLYTQSIIWPMGGAFLREQK